MRLCREFHCLPSQLDEENAEDLVAMLNIVVAGTREADLRGDDEAAQGGW